MRKYITQIVIILLVPCVALESVSGFSFRVSGLFSNPLTRNEEQETRNRPFGGQALELEVISAIDPIISQRDKANINSSVDSGTSPLEARKIQVVPPKLWLDEITARIANFFNECDEFRIAYYGLFTDALHTIARRPEQGTLTETGTIMPWASVTAYGFLSWLSEDREKGYGRQGAHQAFRAARDRIIDNTLLATCVLNIAVELEDLCFLPVGAAQEMALWVVDKGRIKLGGPVDVQIQNIRGWQHLRHLQKMSEGIVVEAVGQILALIKDGYEGANNPAKNLIVDTKYQAPIELDFVGKVERLFISRPIKKPETRSFPSLPGGKIPVSRLHRQKSPSADLFIVPIRRIESPLNTEFWAPRSERYGLDSSS
jgi:hypothetical protein